MRSPVLFLIGFIFIAGLSAGCADSNHDSVAAEEQVVSVSEKLTPEEAALMASAETETEANPHPVSMETH
jgi:hypothetical protein